MCVKIIKKKKREREGEREKALQVGRGLAWVGVTHLGDGQKFNSYPSLFCSREFELELVLSEALIAIDIPYRPIMTIRQTSHAGSLIYCRHLS